MEVSQQLGNNIVRCIMLGASEGLQRDREVPATGSGIKVPVGDKTLGRLFNVLGDTGSAADINPSITISGIVDNITGKKDLKKQSVPDPAQAPESDDGDSDTEDTSDSLDEQNSQWPIITGYGAYVSSIPTIVNGKQCMTA